MKRLIALVLSAILAFGFCAAVAEGNALPLTEEKVTFTYWKPMHTNAAKVLTDYNDNLVIQELEKRTNIHIDWIHPAIGQETEQFNLMIASQDMPDIIEGIDGYPGGIGAMMNDGLILPLNDLVEAHAPNITKLLGEYDEIKLQSRTNDGKMWGFALWGMWEPERPISPWAGVGIRKDWLDELGLSMPVTIADWEATLEAFKTEKGAVAPLILSKTGFPWIGSFMSAFDIAPEFYPKDGKVIYGFAEPGFKDYLALMNDWYNKGYIDASFASTAADNNFYAEYLTTGKAGAIDVTYHDILPLYNSLLEEGQSVVATETPRMTADQQLHTGQYEWRVAGSKTGLNAKIQNPELAIKWWDYCYSDEAALLFNWGIEGVSYEMVDGKPRFLDSLVNNADGMDYGVWAWKYKLFNGPYLFDMWAMPEKQVELSVAAIGTWAKDNDRAYNMPPIERPADSNAEYNNIMSEVNTYRLQMILKFIMGVEPLDKYDEYVATMNDMGLERAIELQTEALALYNAR